MLKLTTAIRGGIVSIIFAVTTIVISTLVCLIGSLQRLFPKKYRPYFISGIQKTSYCLGAITDFLLTYFLPTRWIINLPANLNRNNWYLIIANHRSGTDILVLVKAFNKIASPITFFLKRELLWLLPITGLACYFAEYAFLVRHSKEDLRKKPHLKGKDIETIKIACDKFKSNPRTIINFLEGTRITHERHQRQKSPYHHLLKPKATGIALVLNCMNDKLSGILDVTIGYSTPSPTFWKLLSGQIKAIEVTAQLLPISKEMIGDYYGDRNFRKKLQSYLNDLWAKKDEQLSRWHQKEQ